jgi:hypothetical protein
MLDLPVNDAFHVPDHLMFTRNVDICFFVTVSGVVSDRSVSVNNCFIMGFSD